MIRLAKPVRRLAVSVPLYSTDPTPLKRAGLQTAPHVHRPACEREGGGGVGGRGRWGRRGGGRGRWGGGGGGERKETVREGGEEDNDTIKAPLQS